MSSSSAGSSVSACTTTTVATPKTVSAPILATSSTPPAIASTSVAFSNTYSAPLLAISLSDPLFSTTLSSRPVVSTAPSSTHIPTSDSSSQSYSPPTSSSFLPSIRAPVFVPSSAPTLAPTLPSRTPQAKKKPKQNFLNTDPKDIEIEFLKRELNLTQTKIVELENAIADSLKTNNVLNARLKTFEDMQNSEMYKKYFSNENSPQTAKQCPLHCPQSSCTPPSCCQITRQCSSLCSNRPPTCHQCPQAGQDLVIKLSEVTKEIELLKIEINNLGVISRNVSSSSSHSTQTRANPLADVPQEQTDQPSGNKEPPDDLPTQTEQPTGTKVPPGEPPDQTDEPSSAKSAESSEANQPTTNDESMCSLEEFLFQDLNC